MGPADPSLSTFTDPSGALAGVLLLGDCRSALPIYWQRLPAHADWLFDRFTTQPQVAGQNAMTKPTLVVVGHGMVGHHFLEDCVNRNLHQQYQIIVLAKSAMPPMTACICRNILADAARTRSLVAGSSLPITALSCASRSRSSLSIVMHIVRTASGHETHWDKLVLATGSYPFVPPVPGNDLPGCFVYRTLDDLDNIAAHAAGSRRGVVVAAACWVWRRRMHLSSSGWKLTWWSLRRT